MNSKETRASIMNSAIIIAIKVYKFLDVSIIFFLFFLLLCQFPPQDLQMARASGENFSLFLT